MYARDHGKTPFSIYQGAWSILLRDLEREILPMVRAEGMALAPFDVLAGGKIRSDAEEQRRRQTGEKGTVGPNHLVLDGIKPLVVRTRNTRPGLGAIGGTTSSVSCS